MMLLKSWTTSFLATEFERFKSAYDKARDDALGKSGSSSWLGSWLGGGNQEASVERETGGIKALGQQIMEEFKASAEVESISSSNVSVSLAIHAVKFSLVNDSKAKFSHEKDKD